MILATTLFFIFGTIVGSFLNVVILRYNSGRSALTGRSACPVCRHELAWFELVPVFSFLALGGKCRKCRSKISWQYPLVELFTGIIFAATYIRYFLLTAPLRGSVFQNVSVIPAFAGMTDHFFFLDLITFSFLIVILVYDLRHKIIPDGLVYAFIILSFLKTVIPTIAGMTGQGFSLLDFLAGPVMFLPFFLLWFISRGRWMGFGDAKLAIGIGWFLGFIGAVSAIVLGFWIGALIGIILLVLQSSRLKGREKKLTIKSEIPFAPFLILGLLLVYFFGFDVVGLHLLLMR